MTVLILNRAIFQLLCFYSTIYINMKHFILVKIRILLCIKIIYWCTMHRVSPWCIPQILCLNPLILFYCMDRLWNMVIWTQASSALSIYENNTIWSGYCFDFDFSFKFCTVAFMLFVYLMWNSFDSILLICSTLPTSGKYIIYTAFVLHSNFKTLQFYTTFLQDVLDFLCHFCLYYNVVLPVDDAVTSHQPLMLFFKVSIYAQGKWLNDSDIEICLICSHLNLYLHDLFIDCACSPHIAM